MSEKETSAKIASIAAHVLNLQPVTPVYNPSPAAYNDLLKKAKSLAGSALSQFEDDDDKGPRIQTAVTVDWNKITNALVGFTENGYSQWAKTFWIVQSQPSINLAATSRGGPRVVWYADPAFWLGGGEATVTYDDPNENEGTFGATKIVNRAALVLGLASMAAKAPRHFADLLNENDDAETHDVFMQYVVLGEIVYG